MNNFCRGCDERYTPVCPLDRLLTRLSKDVVLGAAATGQLFSGLGTPGDLLNGDPIPDTSTYARLKASRAAHQENVARCITTHIEIAEINSDLP